VTKTHAKARLVDRDAASAYSQDFAVSIRNYSDRPIMRVDGHDARWPDRADIT